ncbi:MAG: tripartite tricarboxylate transporter substrate binding protein [Rhizobiales bacterium]|nr:tripartite tricarboxylate transporter substrate binding protein [Hyphomicrobiales bacterium]
MSSVGRHSALSGCVRPRLTKLAAIGRAIALSTGLLSAQAATANGDFPTRPVRILVPFSAGTGIDALARALAEALEPSLHQRPAVINREGASGMLAFSEALTAEPDGHTLVFSGPTQLTVQPLARRELPFRPEAVMAVCQVFEGSFVLAVGERSRIGTFADLLTEVRANPGKLKFGHQGVATATHIQLLWLERETGIDLIEIPYRAHGQLLADLASGALDGAILAAGAFDPALARPLVTFAPERHGQMPEVPALPELGYPAPPSLAFGGLYLARDTPEPAVRAVEQACADAFSRGIFQATIQTLGLKASFLGSRAFARRLEAETDRMRELVPALGLRAE